MADLSQTLQQISNAGTTGNTKTAESLSQKVDDKIAEALSSQIEANQSLSGLMGASSNAEPIDDVGNISKAKDIYEAFYIKTNAMLISLMETQAYSQLYKQLYHKYKMMYGPDATLVKEKINEKIRLVLPDDLV